MEKKYSREIPVKVEREKRGYTLNYHIKETSEAEVLDLWLSSGRSETEGDVPTEDFIQEHKYVYYSIYVAMGKWSYGGIVEAIIREKYTIDQMEAMTNNMAAINAVFMQTLVTDGIIEATKYLKNSIDDDNTANFKEMQEWRQMAKNEARLVFKKE